MCRLSVRLLFLMAPCSVFHGRAAALPVHARAYKRVEVSGFKKTCAANACSSASSAASAAAMVGHCMQDSWAVGRCTLKHKP